MGYPIVNLKKDYEDINADNYLLIAEYNQLLLQAFEEKDFTCVQSFLDGLSDEDKNKLEKTVRTATSENTLAEYVENLKNYTVGVKNQIYFCDKDISEEDFAKIDENLVEDDIVIYTEIINGNKIFNSMKIKQADGTYDSTVEKRPSMTYHITVSDDDVYELETTGETVGVIDMPPGSGSEMINQVTSGKYMKLNIPSNIQDGDIVSITYTGSPSNIKYFKVNNIFYYIDLKYKGGDTRYGSYCTKKEVNFYPRMIIDFVYSSTSLPFTHISGYKNIGIAIYNDGSVVGRNTSMFISKDNCEDTGWIDCIIPDEATGYYSEYTYVDSTYQTINCKPQVRKIGNIVQLRGAIIVSKPMLRFSFTLPYSTEFNGKVFNPTVQNEYFVQVSQRPDDLDISYETNPQFVSISVKTSGEVVVRNLTGTLFNHNEPINLYATWFV